ncbi:MAG TPA: tetratricopeptide repeat protein [Gammaproteobacteria bacterium]
MVSFEARRRPKVSAIALLLAAIPTAAFCQLGSSSDEVLARLANSIEDTRQREGVHSAELIGPMTALAHYYQEMDDPELAIAALQQARQVVRVNYGLFSLEEAPLLRDWIRAERTRGNFEGAWDVEQKLLNLVKRNANDVRVVPILREIADRRLDILERYTRGEYPPEIILGCYYSTREMGECRSGSRGTAKAALLGEALSYYSSAIETLLRTEGYSSDELPGMLMELARICYEHGRRWLGRNSLRFMLAYSVENSAPLFTQTNALVQIADWDLVFAEDRSAADSALEVYQQAYARLRDNGVEQASIERLFSPDVPVVLPAFRPNPLASAKTPETTGSIEIAFEITKYGEPDHVEVVAATNASEDEQDRLVHLIKTSRFRPIVTDGRVEEAARVTVRYHLHD